MPAEPRPAFINRQQLVLRSIDVEQLIDEDHSARLIWQRIGRLDLSLYHAQIEAVEGHAGREHTDPQLLINLWIYAYSRGVSSARELARQCEHEPGAPSFASFAKGGIPLFSFPWDFDFLDRRQEINGPFFRILREVEKFFSTVSDDVKTPRD